MKSMQITFGLLALASESLAFPANTPEETRDAVRNTIIKKTDVPGFDAKKQFVSTHGKHKFVAPNLEVDQRGPCPGLNALANHGYIPHSGVGTIERMAQGVFEGVGLGIDIAQAFSAYGAFSAGDGVTWSIGGPPPNGGVLSDAFPGFFGTPKGISFSHNEYEGDASAAREDLYQFGNDYFLNLGFFKELYDKLPADSLDTLSTHRSTRVEQSIAHNPFFFQGPFTGIGVVGAANSFVFRLFANKSAEYPGGLLSKEDLKSFYGVTGGDGKKLVKHPGMERIPENWYKRSVQDQYSFPLAFEDLAQYAAQNPNTAKVGGNMGKVNTFSGVDVSNLTGGAFNEATLLQGNNLGCFAFQAAAFLAPDFLADRFHDPIAALAGAVGPLTKALEPLGCPKLTKLDKKSLNQYPGYRKSKKGQNGFPGPAQ